MTKVFVWLPPHIVDEISASALTRAESLLQWLLGEFVSHAGSAMVGLLMMALYVMFWLCAPMPVHTSTELLFRKVAELVLELGSHVGLSLGL